MQVIEIKRMTTASKKRIWELWKNVQDRTSWDKSIESIKIDGEFRTNQTGKVKLKGQPERKFVILLAEPYETYIDRFLLPLGGKMDWSHTIQETNNAKREVTFTVTVSGLTSFMLAPIMKSILKRELPSTVDKLISLAEKHK